MSLATRLVCSACGAEPSQATAHPFRCPAAMPDDGIDHVLARELDAKEIGWPSGDDPNPFVRYRTLMYPYQLARAGGMSDRAYVEMVRGLVDRIARLDGRGFRMTPLERSEPLAGRIGLGPPGAVWVKDETANVSGSHKARHLMGVLLQLEIAERLGLDGALQRAPLAIASCGNAALAAATIARAVGRPLEVFVPPVADAGVVAMLKELDAQVTVCLREDDVPGDPSFARMLEAVADGAVPFTCQGSQNALAIEGGLTLGWEIAEHLAEDGEALDHIVIQVGGGALGSAVFQGMAEAIRLGVGTHMPAVHTVQTEGAAPLRRAWERVQARAESAGGDREHAIAAALRHAATYRADYMWPWEEEPRSVAEGILDDETYDWRALVRGMLETGGRAVVVSEEELIEANRIGREATGIDVDHTGTSGLAGLIGLLGQGDIAPEGRCAVLFTGVRRDH
jgi:threonine synthase